MRGPGEETPPKRLEIFDFLWKIAKNAFIAYVSTKSVNHALIFRSVGGIPLIARKF